MTHEYETKSFSDLKTLTDRVTKSEEEFGNLKSYVMNAYTAQHMQNIVTKVGTVEQSVRRVQEQMQMYAFITFFVVFLFLVVLLAIVYAVKYIKTWKDFKPISMWQRIRQNQKRISQKPILSKFGSISAPEIGTISETTTTEEE